MNARRRENAPGRAWRRLGFGRDAAPDAGPALDRRRTATPGDRAKRAALRHVWS
jgi:hypothetical protein